MQTEQVNWEIKFNRRYLQAHAELSEDLLRQELSSGIWARPRLGSEYMIVGMGTTNHQAMPTGFSLNGYKVGIIAKPFDEQYLAQREYESTQIATQRGINVPPVIALMTMGDKALVVTELIHSAEPLSARSLDYKASNLRVYNPSELLEDFVGGIASDLHNAGVVEGDLHLGNLGHQFLDDQPPKRIYFDFEGAFILGDEDLLCKREGRWHTVDQKARIETFERLAVEEVGFFIANLRYRGFPLKRAKLIRETAEIYSGNRDESIGVLRGRRLSRVLSNIYSVSLKKLRSNSSNLGSF